MRLVHVALLAAITGLACGPKPEPASAVHTPPDLPPQSVPSPPPLRFAVTFPPALSSAPLDGRLLVILGKEGKKEPREQVSDSDDTAQIFGTDVDGLGPDQPAILDRSVLGYPVRSLADV